MPGYLKTTMAPYRDRLPIPLDSPTGSLEFIHDDARPIYRTGVDEKTGERFGWDGTKFVPILGTGVDQESGKHVALLRDGSFLPYQPVADKPDDKHSMVDGLGSLLWSAPSRALGMAFGIQNAPYAAFWGYQSEWYKSGDAGAALRGALKSASRSAFQKGDWGDSYSSYWKTVTGKTLQDDLDSVFGVSDDPGQQSIINFSKQVLSGTSAATIEILLAIAMDPIAAPSIALNSIQKALKPYAKVLDKSGAEVIQTFKSAQLKEPSTYWRKYYAPTEQDVRVMKELNELTKNREKFVNVIENLRQSKKAQELTAEFQRTHKVTLANEIEDLKRIRTARLAAQEGERLGAEVAETISDTRQVMQTRQLLDDLIGQQPGRGESPELSSLIRAVQELSKGEPSVGKGSLEELNKFRESKGLTPLREETLARQKSGESILSTHVGEEELSKLGGPWDRTTTDTPHWDSLLKRGEARIVEMTPEEYMKEIERLQGITKEQFLKSAGPERINAYAERMRQGEKAPMPILDYIEELQEGRNRVLAAEQLGEKTIPVVVRSKPGGTAQMRLAKTGVKGARLKFEYDETARLGDLLGESRTFSRGVEKVTAQDLRTAMDEVTSKRRARDLAERADQTGAEVTALERQEADLLPLASDATPQTQVMSQAEKIAALKRGRERVMRRMPTREAMQKIEEAKDLDASERAWLDATDYYQGVLEDTAAEGKTIRGMNTLDDSVNLDDIPEVTLDNLGLQKAYEEISKAIRSLGGRFKKVIPPDTLEDVRVYMEDQIREAYGPWVKKRPARSILREELAAKGVYLHRNTDFLSEYFDVPKKQKFLGLNDKGDLVRPFSNWVEVSEHLGYGKKLDDVAKLHYAVDVDMAANQGMQAFLEWGFPEGFEKAKLKDAWKAAERWKKLVDQKVIKKGGDEWAKQARTVLGRTPAGTQLFDKLLLTRDLAELGFAKDYYKITRIIKKSGIDDLQAEQVRMVLDGYWEHIDDPTVLDLADKEIRPILTELYNKAKSLGIRVEKFREDYFPHHVLDVEQLKSGPKRKEVLEASVREGRFKSLAEAEKMLDSYINRMEGKTSDLRFVKWLAEDRGIGLSEALDMWKKYIAPKRHPITGHLTRRRSAEGIPWYDRNLSSAIASYLLDVHRDIQIYENLGKDLGEGWKLLDRIRAEGGNYKLAEEFMKRYTDPIQFPGPDGWRQKALGFQVMTKLGPLTTILNMTQNLATAMATSPTALAKAIKGYDKEFAQDAAAVLRTAMEDIMLAHGATSPMAANYMRRIGFKKSEEILRTIAANTGKIHAERMAEWLQRGKRVNYAERQLRNLGLDPKAIKTRGFLTDDETLLVAKRISDRTQFRGDLFDVPLKWLGPNGRLVTQYKTFIYNQAMLVKRAVADELRHGNFGPALFLVTAYPAAGVAYDVLINQAILGKDSPGSNPFAWWWRGLTTIGSLGMFEAALTAVSYGEKSALQFIMGPTASDIATLGVQTYNTFTGQNTNWFSQAGRRVPYINRMVRAYLAEQKKGVARARMPHPPRPKHPKKRY